MRFKRKTAIVAAVLLLSLGGGAFLWWRSRNAAPAAGQEKNVPDRFYTVKKGELIIGIRQTGFINSKTKHKLAFEPYVQTKLLWIIEENSKVKKGDVLAKFEMDDLNEKIDQFRLEIDNLEKELKIEEESRKILVSTNESAIRAARDKVADAESSLKKYRNFERRQKRDSLELSLEKALKTYDETGNNHLTKKNEYDTKSFSDEESQKKALIEINNLLQKFDDAKNAKRNAELDLKVFKRYTHPDKVTSLGNQLDQAKLELNKTIIQTASQVLQKDKAMNNLQVRLKNRREQLAKNEGFISQMEIMSPVDGVVIYGDPDRRWGNPEIKLGMDVRRMQVLLTIPDMSQLIVEFDLPELYRSKVKIGDKVVITPESLKNIRVEGSLAQISQLPVNQIHWDRNSPKIYKSEVTLDSQEPKLVSGMSVQLEVITQVLKNVVFVPVEAVFEESGKYFVYKKSLGHPKKREVTIGKANDNYVQILEGLEENDVVYLYTPFQRKEGES